MAEYGRPKPSVSARHIGSHRHYPMHKRLGERGSDGRGGCAVLALAAAGSVVALVSTFITAVASAVV